MVELVLVLVLLPALLPWLVLGLGYGGIYGPIAMCDIMQSFFSFCFVYGYYGDTASAIFQKVPRCVGAE